MHHAIGLWRENQSLFIATEYREAGFEQDSINSPVPLYWSGNEKWLSGI
jgi:hypothetical protein